MIKRNTLSSNKGLHIVDFAASARLPRTTGHRPAAFQSPIPTRRHNNKKAIAASPTGIPIATGIPSPFHHPGAWRQDSPRGATVYLNGPIPCGTLFKDRRGPIRRVPTSPVCSEGRLNGLRNTERRRKPGKFGQPFPGFSAALRDLAGIERPPVFPVKGPERKVGSPAGGAAPSTAKPPLTPTPYKYAPHAESLPSLAGFPLLCSLFNPAPLPLRGRVSPSSSDESHRRFWR